MSAPKPESMKRLRQRKRAKSLSRAFHHKAKPAKPRQTWHPQVVIPAQIYPIGIQKPVVDPAVIARAYKRFFEGETE